jgi:hypothetical protein
MTAIFIGEVEVADENRHDFEKFLTQANKELADAGAKHIAGGFDNAVSWLVLRRKTDTSSFNSTAWTRCKSGGRDQPALL